MRWTGELTPHAPNPSPCDFTEPELQHADGVPQLGPCMRSAFQLLLALLGASSIRVSTPPISSSCLTMSSAASSVACGGGGDSAALELHRALRTCAKEDTPIGRAVSKGLETLSDALRLYGPEGVVASFNGGKDAVVILHLMRAALAAHNEASGGSARLRAIFFEVDDEFPEVDAFVRDSVSAYGLDLVAYADVGYADGLKRCIADYGSKAFVLGTRRDDPNAGGQQFFSPSSDWMPPFMRVNPIIEWGYSDVWTFLRSFGLPFCSLYSDGYTSLGKVAQTGRNPALLHPDGSYGPAWELKDVSLERAGRSSGRPPAAAPSAAGAAAATSQRRPSDACRMVVKTAALLIVGDELLSGKTEDRNSPRAARALRAIGVSLRRVCVVGDEISEIASELEQMLRSHDVVITSGGLGPTHDDLTLKAVATTLNCGYEVSPEMQAAILARYQAMGKTISDDALQKMATLPSASEIVQPPDDPDAWPVIRCGGRIFVLPGVPDFFEAKLKATSRGHSDFVARRRVHSPLHLADLCVFCERVSGDLRLAARRRRGPLRHPPSAAAATRGPDRRGPQRGGRGARRRLLRLVPRLTRAGLHDPHPRGRGGRRGGARGRAALAAGRAARRRRRRGLLHRRPRGARRHPVPPPHQVRQRAARPRPALESGILGYSTGTVPRSRPRARALLPADAVCQPHLTLISESETDTESPEDYLQK